MGRYYIQAPRGLLVILMRHGQTAANDARKKRVRGWDDLELDPKGRMAVQLTGNKLKIYKPKYIYSSDFMRDAQTAHILGRILNISGIDQEYDARTWDTGLLSGETEEEADPVFLDIYHHPWKACPGAVETFNDFLARWIGWLESKLDYVANIETMKPSIIVTHGKNIAATQAHFTGTEVWNSVMPVPAGYALLSVGEDHSIEMKFISDTEPVLNDV